MVMFAGVPFAREVADMLESTHSWYRKMLIKDECERWLQRWPCWMTLVKWSASSRFQIVLLCLQGVKS